MSQPDPLFERLRAAVQANEPEEKYSSSYTGEAFGAIGSVLGAATSSVVAQFLSAHRPKVMIAGLAGLAGLGAAFTAASVGKAIGSHASVATGYVVIVAISGIVAAVALNAIEPPVLLEDFS